MNKYMATSIEENGKNIVFVKGAPEIILDRCINEIQNGEMKLITKERREEILSEIQKLQAKSMRILGFGYRTIEDVYKRQV